MKILILMTNSATLTLSTGEKHASGFWAEEFVLPYQIFKQEGYEVDVATIGGLTPSVDKTSIDPNFMPYVRPAGSQVNDSEQAREFIKFIEASSDLKKPLNLDDFTKAQVAAYDGIFLSRGHGAMQDMPKSDAMTQLFRWAIELDKPIAAVCHGGSGILALRTPEGRWPFEGYRMTCFSHEEELVTPIAGMLPFILQFEIERLGGIYEKANVIWGSHVVEDRNLVTGQNPYSSDAVAKAFAKKLNKVKVPA